MTVTPLDSLQGNSYRDNCMSMNIPNASKIKFHTKHDSVHVGNLYDCVLTNWVMVVCVRSCAST